MTNGGNGRVPGATEEQSLQVIQVGLGGFGRGWAGEILPSLPDVTLVACVDVAEDALISAREVTSLPEGRYFTSLDEALNTVEADAVLITASLAAHVPVATSALQAGKHVLVEKPFAPSLPEAQSLVDLAALQGLTLLVSQNYRFFPAPREVASLVDSGEYGSVDAVHVDFRRYDNRAPRGAHRHYSFPDPMVVDMAIHHFDLMRLVLGRQPLEIYCRSWNPAWSNFEEPAEAMAIIRFEDDIMVSYRGSWLSSGEPTAWAGEWRMELSAAEIEWTSRDGKPIESADRVCVRPTGELRRPLSLARIDYADRRGSLRAFTEAIRTGTEPECSGRRNLPTLALTLGAVESSRTGRPVLIGEPRLETS